VARLSLRPERADVQQRTFTQLIAVKHEETSKAKPLKNEDESEGHFIVGREKQHHFIRRFPRLRPLVLLM
jgi:hypothetical protein